jgi:coenzyme F420-dependent glucose-6-phosphate dehydrogenase
VESTGRGYAGGVAEIGYTLSSEEQNAAALVANAARAEEAGFSFAGISDHFHPWISLGVGSGENLNEHILGDRWPAAADRQPRLEEAIEVIRLLWKGGLRSHRGTHYTVENARIYSLPEKPPPILVAVAGEKSVDIAARAGDGLVGTAPVADSIERFRANGGKGKPTYGQLHICWAQSEDEARRTALEWWPNAALSGTHAFELPLPAHFEEIAELVRDDDVAESVVCGPDPERHVDAIREYVDAGYDHVYVHQIGPDQEGFFSFYEREVLPELSALLEPA